MPDDSRDDSEDHSATAQPDLGAEADKTVVAPIRTAPEEAGYTSDGVPTFDSVREKIETRYGTAIGSSELAADTPEGRTVEQQYGERQKAAHDRLEQIKASMRSGEKSGSPEKP
jgi:phage shock protein A